MTAPIKEAINNIKKPSMLKVIVNSIDLLLIVFITFIYYLSLTVETKRVIFIPKGSTNYIITYLTKNHYNLNILDKITLNNLGYPQSGWIDLKSTSMRKFDFLYKLTTSKAALVNITLIPGETYYFFLQQLSKKLKLSQKDLFYKYKLLAYKKDGNILPQTYTLPIGMNTTDLLQYLFRYTNNQYKKYSLKIFGTWDKQRWYKYITIASIIQKEAASTKEMSIIASVIYNRLKKRMKLQMDGTLNYGPYSHTTITYKMIRTNNSDYNTYKHKGIPKNPICAVEFEAIKAAIAPMKTDYLYFVKTADGTKHIFSADYKTHMKNIKKIVKRKKLQRKFKKAKQKRKKAQKKIVHKTVHKKRTTKKTHSLKNLWKSVY